MLRTDFTKLLISGMLLAGIVSGCASDRAAGELAKETKSIVDRLKRDGNAIVLADERTERLRASLLGARIQDHDLNALDLELLRRSGLVAKVRTYEIIENVEKILTGQPDLSKAREYDAYLPETILADYPAVPTTFKSLSAVSKSLGKLQDEKEFADRAALYLAIAKDVSGTIVKAASNSEAAAAANASLLTAAASK